MVGWIYPEVMKSLEDACNLFLSKRLSSSDLQSQIYLAEHLIEAPEEAYIRRALHDAENEIELAIYTVSRDEVDERVGEIVGCLLALIAEGPRHFKGSI